MLSTDRTHYRELIARGKSKKQTNFFEQTWYSVDWIPIQISTNRGTMFDNVFRCKIQNFSEWIVIGERRFVLGNFSKLPIQFLDDVSCIYYLADFGRICKKRRKNIPIILSTSYATAIYFCLIFIELNQYVFDFIFVDCLVNLFESVITALLPL